MLSIDYETSLEQIERIRHITVINLVESNLVKKGVPESYLIQLKTLRDLREYANYPFGADAWLNPLGHFKKQVSKLYEETGIAFDAALDYIFEVSDLISSDYNLPFYIQTSLGDVIGEDIYQTYLSEEDERRVIDYLVSRNLTT